MITQEHKKHVELARPSYGRFGVNEWSIVGTRCSVIKELADKVIRSLSAKYKSAYADAEHNDQHVQSSLSGRMAAGAVTEYVAHINHGQFAYNKTFNPFELRQMFSGMDLILVNGNHFEARAQVVVIDAAKKSSLEKRIDQLTNVELILLTDDANEIFDSIKQAVPGYQNLPVYHINQVDKIINFFESRMINSVPILNGLILAGGKSLRMGFDKSQIHWHGKEQVYYMADLLKNYCQEVFISCRPGQESEIEKTYSSIPDSYTGLGPYGAILSAFRKQPDAAWLVIACDLPLMNAASIEYLISQRNTSSMATTFQSPHDNLPEPLVTIWEPKSYRLLLSFLAEGYSCPRKVLRNSDVQIINPLDVEALTNVNTEAEFLRVKKILEEKTFPV